MREKKGRKYKQLKRVGRVGGVGVLGRMRYCITLTAYFWVTPLAALSTSQLYHLLPDSNI